ncbi:MAG: type II toxin-antitoxin system HicB family antitoxin [Candidatus Aureabacteria bacterium]|nr:type II toxin-antitoxin system HicB family antitoxin [Candidatus Auribacterota bacterium]
MKYKVRLTQVSSGRLIAYCDEPKCSTGAPTRQEALDKIKEEIRYRLEYCPCSAVREGDIEIEVVS